MVQAEFIFHDELKDFLAPSQRGMPRKLTFEEHQTVKHLIESCGVPHTEIFEIKVGLVPVDFSYHPRSGDCVEVFPYQPVDRQKKLFPAESRFVLDMHLGKLARYLRLLGFDAAYRNDFHDLELAEISLREQRILLTRDRGLLMRKQVQLGYCLRALEPRLQLLEVIRCFDLEAKISPFQRCPHCNDLLLPTSKNAVLDRLEPLTIRYYDEFHQCPNCQRVYWKGSHFEHMLGWIQGQIRDVSKPGVNRV